MLGITTAGWLTIGATVLFLVFLEGLLSADNALVLAVMVRHLPRAQQKRALRYGIWGAFLFRAIAVVGASSLLQYWGLKVAGGMYLLYLAASHFLWENHEKGPGRGSRFGGGFWATVVNVEIADIAFSIDSILAAVAMAEGLPRAVSQTTVLTLPLIGPLTMKLVIVYVGGVLGIIAMRLVAGVFLRLLDRFQGLAEGAYVLVGWIGLELVGSGLHTWKPALPLEMPQWVFWVVMGLIAAASLAYKPRKRPDDSTGPEASAPNREHPASPNGQPPVPERDHSERT
jgi:YkoY family integral membrane protein